MWLKAFRFLSLLFVALALAPAMAHLLELGNKMPLNADDYLTVQQIYRGWSRLGYVVAGALFSTILLTIISYRNGRRWGLPMTAMLCIIGTQVIFWVFTFPANQITDNWSRLPENWEQIRRQWEYSHAVAAGLNLIALLALIYSVVYGEDRREDRVS